MFDDEMIDGDRLEPGPIGSSPTTLRLRIRLPWYRSLPLSCVEALEVEVDGSAVPLPGLVLHSNGHAHAVEDLTALDGVEWFILDALALDFATEEQLAAGPHRVSMSMRLRIPYGDPDYGNLEFVHPVRCTKQLALGQGAR